MIALSSFQCFTIVLTFADILLQNVLLQVVLVALSVASTLQFQSVEGMQWTESLWLCTETMRRAQDTGFKHRSAATAGFRSTCCSTTCCWWPCKLPPGAAVVRRIYLIPAAKTKDGPDFGRRERGAVAFLTAGWHFLVFSAPVDFLLRLGC